jgi:hypothetical protein
VVRENADFLRAVDGSNHPHDDATLGAELGIALDTYERGDAGRLSSTFSGTSSRRKLCDKPADLRFGAREPPQLNVRDVGLSSGWEEKEAERRLAQATFEANTAKVCSEILKHGGPFNWLPF